MTAGEGGDDAATVGASIAKRNASIVAAEKEPLPFIFVFSILLIPRLLAARYSIMGDCDEVFNYWEPTHYLVHGTGFQTWEYSPTYAIRSWAYVAIHASIIKVFELLGSSKVQPTEFEELKFQIAQFYSLRVVLGVVSAYCESVFVHNVHVYKRGRIGDVLMFLLAASAGMFAASTGISHLCV
jgi:alpha-1,2-mannosyltransferase